MKIRIISEIKELNSIKDDWDDLYAKADYSTFQSFEFNYYSWLTELSKAKGNQLCVVLLATNERTCAILPLYIDFNKRLRFINDKHADFCDVLSKEKFDFEDVLSEIRKHFKLYSVHFINLTEDSFLYALYKKKVWKNSLLKPFEKYSTLNLDKGTFPYNVLKYTSKQKTEFRRIKKKSAENTHHFLLKDNSNFPIQDIYQLKERMIGLGLRKANFLNEDRLILLKELYNSNRMIVSMVKSKSNICAISFILRNTNEYLFWIDMYDNSKMINIYNYISFIERISQENNIKINFGRGVYDYKVTNFKPDIKQLFAFYIFSNKLQLLIFLFVDNIKEILKSIYKKIKR